MKTALRLVRLVLWRWEETLAVTALIVVVSSVSFGVISRYVTATSATWAVELSSLAFTWAVFLGAAAAFRRRMHVSVDLFVRLLPTRVSMLVSWAIDLLLLAFLSYVLFLSILITMEAAARPSPVLRIPFTYVYGALVLSLASMLIHHFLQMVLRLRTQRDISS